MIALRFAWREIRNNPRFSLFFVLNLAMGLFGFVILDSFKSAFDESLSARSKILLSADLAISARRPLTPDEDRIIDAIIPKGSRQGRMIETYSMVASHQSSRLVALVAIDRTYPFYGELELERRGKIRGDTPKPIIDSPSVWIYPELATQLGLKPGDAVKVGDSDLQVDDIIKSDSGEVWRGFSLATRMYLGLSELESTRLLSKGSTAYWSRLFQLPPQTDIEKLSRELDLKLKDPGIQVRTHRDASEEVGRLMGYLNDYLGLVALTALFLAGIGASYLFRTFLARRVKDIAILTSLGITNRFARRIYLIQLGTLGAFAAIVSCLVAVMSLPLIGWFVAPYLPFQIHLPLTTKTALFALLLGSVGSILICYPVLLKIRELSPAALFQESVDPSTRFSRQQVFGIVPGLVVLAMLSVWQAHSLKVGSLFYAVFLASLFVLALAGVSIISLLARMSAKARFRVRMAIRNLARSRLSTISSFVAIGIGSLLLNLIPSIQASLDAELKRPSDNEMPSLFFFDIQEDQVNPLREYLKRSKIELNGLSPLVRSRLISINGAPFEKSKSESPFSTREEEQAARSRNRGFNLSYRTQLTSAEKTVSGRDFSGNFDPAENRIPEISLERRFAERLNIHIGDVLDFDVQGVPIQGKVIGLRKVRWTSFQPNFFILFQPGVLDGAPKTFIASLPKLGIEQKIALQNGVVEKFPNVSMVDIGDVANKILDIFDQMSAALQIMAILSIFSGFVVLFSIANQQALSRRQETNLLKVLGASFSDVRGIVWIEFSILGLSASVLGAGISYGVSWLVTEFLFDGSWVLIWKTPLLLTAGIGGLAGSISLIATWSVLLQKPIALLQSGT